MKVFINRQWLVTGFNASICGLGLLLISLEGSWAQTQNDSISGNSQQQVVTLSKDKWRWMADKNVDSLAALFEEKSVFVHMGGSWGKQQEVNIIKSGGIHYKKADIHKVSVNIIGTTAVLLNRITLLAVVGGREVTNEFEVTEVYIQQNGTWKLGSLSFTKVGG
ncbi:nuclear transport factor 2 family protein [Dyadobacter sp. LHD-138]|uniref:nuclear transport factor 2 family protein n=1 Tax=Dyadobacter sp. LHD-138 TaxID=3071413 RepID=UPI0027DF0B88|nr:nuclear transport factor 2 family protein [Dyadobacter sp. LHD-138]MDQ6477115.1 nuclear transport factor 2 family protein [Dyadobacter sp. LHD-138]